MSSAASNMAIISNQQFWFLTFALIVFWAVVIATAEPASATAMSTKTKSPTATSSLKTAKEPNSYEPTTEKDIKHARNCKALCEHCGCLGFYCGEECICECNNENSDTECIAVMQSNARKLAIPFEILIQGPTANKFVRTAQQFEQNTERKGMSERSKRSTVTIYKPAHQNSLDLSDEASHKSHLLLSSKNSLRRKRAVPHLDWFTDLANTLVRPAPLGAAQRKDEETTPVRTEATTTAATGKRGGDELDRSWFTDSTKLLLRPAPLFKRSRYADDDDDSKETPPAVRAVEKLPQVLKETLRNIKEAAIVDDFTDAMRTSLKDGTEVLQNNLQTNLDFLSPNLRTDIGQVISKLKFIGGDMDVGSPMEQKESTPDTQPKYVIPWFRPVRFLKRVREAIN